MKKNNAVAKKKTQDRETIIQHKIMSPSFYTVL